MKKRPDESPTKTQQRKDIHKADQRPRKVKILEYRNTKIIPLKTLKEMDEQYEYTSPGF